MQAQPSRSFPDFAGLMLDLYSRIVHYDSTMSPMSLASFAITGFAKGVEFLVMEFYVEPRFDDKVSDAVEDFCLALAMNLLVDMQGKQDIGIMVEQWQAVHGPLQLQEKKHVRTVLNAAVTNWIDQ